MPIRDLSYHDWPKKSRLVVVTSNNLKNTTNNLRGRGNNVLIEVGEGGGASIRNCTGIPVSRLALIPAVAYSPLLPFPIK